MDALQIKRLKIKNNTNSIKIICKDKTIYLQEGMLPDIEYIKAKFSFQKTQGIKKLTLEFAEYESGMINEILTNEFINNKISFSFYSLNIPVQEFDTIYKICHEMNYTGYCEKLLINYMSECGMNDKFKKKLFEVLNLSDGEKYKLTYFSHFMIIDTIYHIFITYIPKTQKHYYIWNCNAETKKYLKNKEDENKKDENKGIENKEDENIENEAKYIAFDTIDAIHADLTDEYFLEVKNNTIKYIINFCEKYGLYKDAKNPLMKHLNFLLRICRCDKQNIINTALSETLHINN